MMLVEVFVGVGVTVIIFGKVVGVDDDDEEGVVAFLVMFGKESLIFSVLIFDLRMGIDDCC
jgi:hypothetical protein